MAATFGGAASLYSSLPLMVAVPRGLPGGVAPGPWEGAGGGSGGWEACSEREMEREAEEETGETSGLDEAPGGAGGELDLARTTRSPISSWRKWRTWWRMVWEVISWRIKLIAWDRSKRA